MKQTFLNHFSAIQEGISPSLLDPWHVNSVKELCSMFPFDIASDFGFESRLGNPEAVCDFFLQIKKKDEGAVMLAGKSPVSGLSPDFREDPFWKRISALFAALVDSSGILADRVELFWLEFDCMEVSFNTIPNIFFKIREEEFASRFSQWESINKVLDEIYKILFSIPFPPELDSTLKKCMDSLPENAGIYQVGFMIPRKTEAIRLILSRMNKESLFSYLEIIDWPGQKNIVESMITRICEKFDYVVYNLHIGKTVLPFLGVEMYFKDLRQPMWEPRWNDVFDLLEAENLLLETKRQGLIDFCRQKTVSHLFPVRYLCGINHLKLVYKKEMPLECKAYFGTMIFPPDQTA